MNRNWVGWVGIGLGALALLIALSGWGFGSLFASGAGRQAPPAYAQAGQSQVPQNGRFTPNASGAPRADQRRTNVERPGQSRGGGFIGRWFSFPFKLLEGLRNAAIVVLLIMLGVVLLRGRNVADKRTAEVAPKPAQQESPTGESYVD